MRKNPFAEYFDDVSDLNVFFNEKVLYKVTGTAELNNIIYKITISKHDITNQRNCHKAMYSGTISIIDPLTNRIMISEKKKRDRENKGLSYTNKDLYATITYRCNTSNMDEIISTLMRQIDSLLCANKDQLKYSINKSIMPERLTFKIACEKYLDAFLCTAYPKASSETNLSRSKQITKVIPLLPNKPICKLKRSKIASVFRSSHVGEGTTELCYLFIEYLIQCNKLTGQNMFPSVTTKNPSEKELEKAAFGQKGLDPNVFSKMFFLLNRNVTPINCVIALLASGFTLSDISGLTWGDIELGEEKDYVIVHIRKDHLRVAKHDFSRPAIPDTALYLRKAYAKLSKGYRSSDFTKGYIKPTELDSPQISIALNNLLIMSNFIMERKPNGRPSSDEPIPIRILRINYERMLIELAGLKDDPDTRSFLLGKILKSSTYINYESHTSKEAQDRLYSILKPLSIETKINKESGIFEDGDNLAYEAFPHTNHEIAQINGSITIPPGAKIIIRCPHGVTGCAKRIN